MTIENYDFYCVDYSKRLVDMLREEIKKNIFAAGEVENAITKGLSVLYNNGVHAFFLFMIWKKNSGTRVERRVYKVMDDLLIGKVESQSLLRLKDIQLALDTATGALEVGKTLSQNLDNLLFANELLSRTLSYARYQAKGIG